MSRALSHRLRIRMAAALAAGALVLAGMGAYPSRTSAVDGTLTQVSLNGMVNIVDQVYRHIYDPVTGTWDVQPDDQYTYFYHFNLGTVDFVEIYRDVAGTQIVSVKYLNTNWNGLNQNGSISGDLATNAAGEPLTLAHNQYGGAYGIHVGKINATSVDLGVSVCRQSSLEYWKNAAFDVLGLIPLPAANVLVAFGENLLTSAFEKAADQYTYPPECADVVAIHSVPIRFDARHDPYIVSETSHVTDYGNKVPLDPDCTGPVCYEPTAPYTQREISYSFTVSSAHQPDFSTPKPTPTPTPTPTPPVGQSPSTYHPQTPARIVDSRTGLGLSGKIGNKAPASFQVTGRGGVPANANAVTGNLTVTGQTGNGYLYLGPYSDSNPSTSTLNFPVGDNRANAVTAPLSPYGTLSVTYVTSTAGATTHVIFDVTGYFTPDTSGYRYHPITPARIVDSRIGLGVSSALQNRSAATFQAAGVGGVPLTAWAVTGNLTVTGQTGAGYLYLGPYADNNPGSSTLNFPVGDTRANAVSVFVPGSTLSVTYVSTAGATAHVIFDVTGYFANDTTGYMYRPLNPARIVDSRSSLGLTKLSAKVSKSFTVCGRGGVPNSAYAVTGNLTVTNQTTAGYLYLGPYQDNNPTTSTLNFPVKDNRANAVSVYLPGTLLWVTYGAASGTTDVIFDVNGYYAR